jgi:hypothetical protein
MGPDGYALASALVGGAETIAKVGYLATKTTTKTPPPPVRTYTLKRQDSEY